MDDVLPYMDIITIHAQGAEEWKVTQHAPSLLPSRSLPPSLTLPPGLTPSPVAPFGRADLLWVFGSPTVGDGVGVTVRYSAVGAGVNGT